MSNSTSRNARAPYALDDCPNETHTRDPRLVSDSEPHPRSVYSSLLHSALASRQTEKPKQKKQKKKNPSPPKEEIWNNIMTDDDTVRCVDDVLPTAEKSVPDDQSKVKRTDARKYTPSVMANIFNDKSRFANLGNIFLFYLCN